MMSDRCVSLLFLVERRGEKAVNSHPMFARRVCPSIVSVFCARKADCVAREDVCIS